MKSLLSLIICITMLLGAAPVADVPQTQTVLTLHNIRVCADNTCVDVAPEAKLTVAQGLEQANATLELIGGEEPVVFALQSEAGRMVLVPNSGRMFTAETSRAVPALVNGGTEALLKLDAVQPIIDCLHTVLTERAAAEIEASDAETADVDPDAAAEDADTEAETTEEDFFAQVFEALENTTGAQPMENQVTINRSTVVGGKTLQTELSLLTFFEMLDKLAAGSDTTARLMQACLESVVKADGGTFGSFAEIAENASEQILPVEQIIARGEDVRYDRLEIDPTIDDGEKGVCTLEIISREDKGASVKFHMDYTEGDEHVEYEAQIDLQGTLAAPACIFFKDNMTDTKSPEEEVEQVRSRHDDLVLTQSNGLWNAAGKILLAETATDAVPVETQISIGYTEALQPEEVEEAAAEEAVEPAEGEVEEAPVKYPTVIGKTEISIASAENTVDVSFEIMRQKEAFADIMEPLAEMVLTENPQEIPAMVFGLDLEEMNAAVRALFDLEGVREAADMLKIDLSELKLLGEDVTVTQPEATQAPEETEVPEETEAPDEEPIVQEPEVQQAVVEGDLIPEEEPQEQIEPENPGDPFANQYPTL